MSRRDTARGRVCSIPILFALALLLALPAPARAGTQPLSGIHVSGGRIVDGQGRSVILRGINAMDKVVGVDGDLDPDLDDADLERIASIGFNVLRLGTSWAAVEPEPGVYDDAFIGRFRALMDGLYAHGLLAVVDMHQDVWGEAMGGNGAPAWAGPRCNVPPHLPLAQATGQFFMDYFSPDTQAAFSNFWQDGQPDAFCTGPVQTRFVAMWTHFASRLAGHPALVGYDLLNEPWPGTPPGIFEVAQLYPFYRRAAASIRAADPRSIVFFEPPIQKSAGVPTVPAGAPDPQSVYAPHLYTETMFSSGAITTGALTDDVAQEEDGLEAAAMGVPVWIGEWGAFENAAAERYQRAFYDVMDRARLGSAYWHYAQGYPPSGLKYRPPPADAGHIRVYPEAYPEGARWRFDARARTLTIDAATAGTVRLVVPARLYPEGVRFAGDGTVTYDSSSNRAEWTIGGPATLLVTPAA